MSREKISLVYFNPLAKKRFIDKWGICQVRRIFGAVVKGALSRDGARPLSLCLIRTDNPAIASSIPTGNVVFLTLG